MKVGIFLRRFSAIAIVIFAVGQLRAQNPGTGSYPYARSDSFGFDSVNPGNLNVHFSIPVVSKQGRGLPFQYSLEFDSLIWTPVTSGSSKVWTPDPSFGLHGYLLNDGYKGFLSYSNISRKCFDDPGNPGYWEWLPILSNFVYHDEFGVNHAFNYINNFCTGVITGDGSTSDGSGYYYDGANVRSSSNTSLNLPNYVNGVINSATGTIIDSNGNKVTNNQNGTFTDTMGKTPLTIGGSGTPSSPRTFTYYTTTGTAPSLMLPIKLGSEEAFSMARRCGPYRQLGWTTTMTACLTCSSRITASGRSIRIHTVARLPNRVHIVIPTIMRISRILCTATMAMAPSPMCRRKPESRSTVGKEWV